jgi:hypothetical protein
VRVSARQAARTESRWVWIDPMNTNITITDP